MPLVSVIIPAYNAEPYIADAVGSILAQKFQDFEIVIAADDGQDYVEVLKSKGVHDSRIRCANTGGVATGPSCARNAALHMAVGRVVASLDADDILREDALEILVPKALEHGAAYSDIIFIEFESGRALPNYNKSLPAGVLTLRKSLSSYVQGYAWMVFDREKLPHARWHEEVSHFDDLLFFVECSDALGHLYYSPERLYVYRRRQGSICNTPDVAQKFISAAEFILRELEAIPSMFNHTVGSRDVFKAYMQRWHRLETLFEQALAEGKYSDYQDFLRDNCNLLYSL